MHAGNVKLVRYKLYAKKKKRKKVIQTFVYYKGKKKIKW